MFLSADQVCLGGGVQEDGVLAIENRRLAGEQHWLILPEKHRWRDIENLTAEDLPLVEAMQLMKKRLIESRCPGLPASAIVSGFHRGRRPLLGNVYYPDIVSIHHLHMHVIVRPRPMLRLFKYPAWLPLMWKSDARVVQKVRRLAREEGEEQGKLQGSMDTRTDSS